MSLASRNRELRACRDALRSISIATIGLLLLLPGLPSDAAAQGSAKAVTFSIDERNALNHKVFQSRAMQVALARIRQRMGDGNRLQSIEALQRLLDRESDSLFWESLVIPSKDSEGNTIAVPANQLSSVRREARRLLESQGVDGLKLYEQTYGAAATILSKEARRHESSAALGDVARRYFLTEAGFQAVDELATRALDNGQADIAAGLFLTLIESNAHRNRVGGKTFLKAATALQMSGQLTAGLALIESAADRGRINPATAHSIEAAVLALKGPRTFPDKASNWLTPFGDLRHNGAAAGSAPWLDPAWSIQLDTNHPFDELAEWQAERESDELQETGVACYPILALGQLVFRDYDGIRACDPGTGETLWRYNSPVTAVGFAESLRKYTSNDTLRAELAWAGNPVTGVVTSDGERIFAVEYLSFDAVQRVPNPASNAPRATSSSPRQFKPVCRVVSLRIPDAHDRRDEKATLTVAPEWTAGGLPAPTADNPLGGHVFLGAPLAVGGSVYLITEADLELHLVKLDANTGRTIWIQKLGLVERPLFESSQNSRSRLSSTCLPAIAGSTILCPTDTALLVAVDRVRGEILWIYHALEPSRFRNVTRTRTYPINGFAGMASPPVVRDSTVVWLPRQSKRLHCIDLKNGESVWSVPRENALYVGCVTDRYALIVGQSGVRAHSLQDGSVVWQCRLGIPSGRGIRVENSYLVPLKSGGIAAVDIRTGAASGSSNVPALQERRFQRAAGKQVRVTGPPVHELNLAQFGLADEHVPSDLRPGNLLLHDGLVFSMGPRHVTAFPQASRLLKTLALREGPDADGRSQLLRAQLELATGRNQDAQSRLEKLVAAAGRSEQVTETDARRARWMLRELLVDRLHRTPEEAGSDGRRKMLAQLQTLSHTDRERAEVLVEQTRLALEEGGWDEAIPAAREVASLGLSSFMVPDRESGGVLSSDSWARDVLARAVRNNAVRSGSRAGTLLQNDFETAGREDSVESLEKFVAMYAATEQGQRVRNRLADRLIREGRFQQAELHLLQNRKGGSIEARAVAQILLAALWDRLEFHAEAAIALQNVLREFAGASIASVREDRLISALNLLDRPGRAEFEELDTPTGRQFLAAFNRESETWTAFQNRQPVDWPVRRVLVTKHQWSASRPELAQSWSSGRRLSMRGRAGVHVVRTVNATRNDWLLIDRYSGSERGRIRMPSRLSVRTANKAGHFLPVGTRDGMQGVSLMEFHDQEPQWSLTFPPIAASDNKLVEAGPATPSVCVFQTRKHLIGVDPAKGRVLWRKSDLDLASGVFVDREAGLFGDEQVTVLFHGDQTSYTMFSTQTGEVLRRGNLNVEFRYLRRLFGRKLFHVTRLDPTKPDRKRRIRIWDPLHDRMELDEEFEGRFYAEASSNRDLLAILKAGQGAGRLIVFEMPQVRKLVDLPLSRDAMDGVSALRIMADENLLYVNMQRTLVQGVQRRYHYLATDTAVPVDHVQQGSLMAIHRRTGRVAWNRPCLQKTFLKLEDCSLPFLVGISRVRPRDSSSIQALHLEVVDRRTGEVLGQHNSLFPDRIVHTRIDRNRGMLTLYGISGRVELDFSRQTQAIPLEPPRL